MAETSSLESLPSPAGLWLADTPLPVQIYVYTDRRDGRLLGAFPESLVGEGRPLGPAPEDQVEHTIASTWTIPDADRLRRYRRSARTWIATAQSLVPDLFRLRALLIRNHLQSLAVTDPATGQPFAVEHHTHPNGDRRLTPETEVRLRKLHPRVIEALVDKYQKDAVIFSY